MEKLQKIFLTIGIILLALIPVWRFLAVPEFEKLQAGYNERINFIGTTAYYNLESNGWDNEFIIKGGYTEQVVKKEDDMLIIKTEQYALNPQGGDIYRYQGEFAVDRGSFRNVHGYEGHATKAHYMFPSHLQKTDYTIFGPISGIPTPVTYKFIEEDVVQNLRVFVFEAGVEDTDTTEIVAGDLKDAGAATIRNSMIIKHWVEPQTGKVIKVNMIGKNWFADENGNKIRDLLKYTWEYSEDSVLTKIRIAQNKKQQIILYEIIIPILMGVIAAAILAAAYIGGGRSKK